MTNQKVKIAFICVHNSCRSQMAEALCRHLANDMFEAYSAGTETKPRINPDAVRIIKQLYNIDMEVMQHSKLIADIPNPDILITMGCNVVCPWIPNQHQEDWGLDDPSGLPDDAFIKTAQIIEQNIKKLKTRVASGEIRLSY